MLIVDKLSQVKSSYDCVCIGPNPSSLFSASLLALQRHVLYIETSEDSFDIGIGPQSNTFPICTCYFDLNNGPLQESLRKLGCELYFTQPSGINETTYLDSHKIMRSGNLEEYKNALVSNYPEEHNAINSLFEIIVALADEWSLIVNQKVGGNWAVLQQTRKFLNIRYVDYVLNEFKDQQLIRTLLIDIPYTNIGMVNMAGSLVQKFNSSRICGGYSVIREALLNSILKNGSDVIRGSSYKVNASDNTILIEIDNQQLSLSSSFIISSDPCFADGECIKRANRRSTSMMLNFKLEQPIESCFESVLKVIPGGDLAKKLHEIESGSDSQNPPFTVHFPLSEENDACYTSMQVESFIPYGSSSEQIEKYSCQVINELQKLGIIESEQDNSYVIIAPDEIERRTGIYGGTSSLWAFSPEEMRKNLLQPIKKEQKIIYAGSWGNAFFAFGKVIADAIND